MGSQRAFISMPAAMAASAAPPPTSTLSAANCAPPEKTSTDIATGAIGPMIGRARIPNEIPSATVGRTIGSAARMPARISLSACIRDSYQINLFIR